MRECANNGLVFDEETKKMHIDGANCVGCGRCYISCFDGGHQALRMDEKRQPLMDAKKCVGCQLCKLVCPTGSITAGTRVEKRK